MREVVPRETDEAAREAQEAKAAATAARQAAARKSAMKAVEALRQQRRDAREVAAAPVDTWQSEEAKRTNVSLFNEDTLQYCST